MSVRQASRLLNPSDVDVVHGRVVVAAASTEAAPLMLHGLAIVSLFVALCIEVYQAVAARLRRRS